MSETNEKAGATYRLRLKADSGYEAATEGRCTPEQYSDAMAALHGKPSAEAAKLQAQRDELLEALRMWMDIHDSAAGFTGKFGRELDAAIAAQQAKVGKAVDVSRAAISKATGAA